MLRSKLNKRVEPMELTPMYEKTTNCPLCTKSFKTLKIRARFIRVVEHKTDFQPVYQDPANNPNLYHINVCNECGYSFTDDFAPYFPPQARKQIDRKITQQWKAQNYCSLRTEKEAISCYKLAISCEKKRKLH